MSRNRVNRVETAEAVETEWTAARGWSIRRMLTNVTYVTRVKCVTCRDVQRAPHAARARLTQRALVAPRSTREEAHGADETAEAEQWRDDSRKGQAEQRRETEGDL